MLLNTPLIRDMIRRGQIHEIKEAMDRSLQEGMQTFDQSLYRLYKDGRIELEEALSQGRFARWPGVEDPPRRRRGRADWRTCST